MHKLVPHWVRCHYRLSRALDLRHPEITVEGPEHRHAGTPPLRANRSAGQTHQSDARTLHNLKQIAKIPAHFQNLPDGLPAIVSLTSKDPVAYVLGIWVALNTAQPEHEIRVRPETNWSQPSGTFACRLPAASFRAVVIPGHEPVTERSCR